MDELPAELILHIVRFLDPPDIIPLQLASKEIYRITRDNELWKQLCLENSHSEAARKRRDFLSGTPIPIQEPRVFELQRAVARSTNSNGVIEATSRDKIPQEGRVSTRAMACWDPTYPGEKVDWYDEYIARHAPLSISWLQQPLGGPESSEDRLEIRGLGLLKDHGENIVVAPLDDGSVCLWDIGEDDAARGIKNGRIMARSRPSVLSVNGPDGTSWQNSSKSRAKMTSTGVVECVSIDKARNKAYFAVQSGLNEVDLSTLQISSYDRYPFSISCLSEATHPVPLTVGTTSSLHIHDPRIGHNGRRSSYTYFTESVDIQQPINRSQTHNYFDRLHNGDPSSVLDYATLFQPLPLSILHDNPSSTIYVAGRFPSILTYDRRVFPKLTSTIHSGGSLCSLTSLPTPDAVTLAAAGEYNGKGSLEIYTLSSPSAEPSEIPTPNGIHQTRNRTSASSSKLLSLALHGTRLLFSDSGGQLKWVERDGSTLVRRWNINSYFNSTTNIAPTQGIFNNDPNEGDVARKLLPVSRKERSEALLWTGEKIGLLGFKKKPRFDLEGEDSQALDGTTDRKEVEERDYKMMMRRALKTQAAEVRFVRGLGLRP